MLSPFLWLTWRVPATGAHHGSSQAFEKNAITTGSHTGSPHRVGRPLVPWGSWHAKVLGRNNLIISFSLSLSLLLMHWFPCCSLNPSGTVQPILSAWSPLSPCTNKNCSISLLRCLLRLLSKASWAFLPVIATLNLPWHFPSLCWLIFLLLYITI